MADFLRVDAWKTTLGNLTAKSVLGYLCDRAGDGGECFPSLQTIARETEISERTVRRLLDVLEAIGLIERVIIHFRGKQLDGFHIFVERLKGDYHAEFAEAYARAQGKEAVPGRRGKLCLRDTRSTVSETEKCVSETEKSVSETEKSVSETKPPHPLNGGTVIELPVNPQAREDARGECVPDETEPPDMPLDEDQLGHLERLSAEGRDQSRAEYEKFYREMNAARRAQQLQKAKAEREKAAELERKRAEFPDVGTAVRKVMDRCGWVWDASSPLGVLIRNALTVQEKQGKPPWEMAPLMADNWLLHRQVSSEKLRVKYGPAAFIRDGHWIDSNGWNWVKG